MSNPFQLFRKYQKGMLTFGAILALAIFGLAPALDYLGSGGRYAGGGAGGGPEAVKLVKYKGGTLTDLEIVDFRNKHFSTVRFLSALRMEARNKEVPQRAPFLIGIPSEDDGVDYANRRTLELMMQAEKAEQEGIEITDQTVEQYLLMASGGIVDPADYRKLLGRLSVSAMKIHLKKELAALNFEYMLRSGLGGATLQNQMIAQSQRNPFALQPSPSPVESWIAFDKLNRKASCTVVDLDIKDYLKEVPESPANDAGLRSIYEDGKDRILDPSYSEPGFRIPAKASFGYFVINKEDILKREAEKISDEKVQETYDAFVKSKDKIVVEVLPAKKPEPPKPDDKDPKTDVKDPADSKKPDETGEDKLPAEEGGKDKSDKTDDAKKEGDESEKKADEKDDSGCDFEPQEDVDQKADEGKSEEKKEVEKEQPKKTADDPETPDVKKEDPTGTEGKEEATEEKEEGKQPPTKTAEELEPETRIKKLTEVEQEIRESLVEKEELEKKIKEVREKCSRPLINYGNELEDWKEAEKEGETTEKPGLPDFEKIADENGIEYHSIDKLMSYSELSSAGTVKQTLAGYGFYRIEKAKLYRPTAARLAEDGVLVLWLTEKTNAKVPDFDECREQVVEYWRHQQAIEATKKAAEKLIAEVKASKQTLEGAKLDQAKNATFTWMSSTQIGAPPTVSSLFDLSLTDEFMEKVFSIEVTSMDYAMDLTNQKVIVFQVTSRDNDDLTLREQYFKSPIVGFQTSQAENQRVELIIRDYKVKMMKDMGIKWLK